MGLREEMAAGIADEIIASLADTAKFDGTVKRCFVTTANLNFMVTTNGNPADVKVSVLIINGDFAKIPRSGSKVVYPPTGATSKEYKVALVRDVHAVASWLDCVDWKSQ